MEKLKVKFNEKVKVEKEESRDFFIPFIKGNIDISRYIFEGAVGVKFTLPEGNEQFPLGASLIIVAIQNGEGIAFINDLYHNKNMIMNIMELMEKIYRLKHLSNLYISFVISSYEGNPTKLKFDGSIIKDTTNKPKFKDFSRRERIWSISPTEINSFLQGLEQVLTYV